MVKHYTLCKKKSIYEPIFVLNTAIAMFYFFQNMNYYPHTNQVKLGWMIAKKSMIWKYFVFGHYNLTDEYRCIFNIWATHGEYYDCVNLLVSN